MTSRILMLLSSVAFTAFLTAGTAQAHDPTGKGGPPKLQQKQLMESLQGLTKLTDAEEAKGLYRRLTVWPPTFAKLRVCFMGGNKDTNAKIAEIANDWTDDPEMSLRLDFGKPGKLRVCDPTGRPSQVRISYDQPGYWSYVGQESVVELSQDKASLNLEGLVMVDPDALEDPEIRGTILHEFGHALALEHEHQSPASKCQKEFNWPYLIKYLGGPPNYWDKETIEFNLGRLEGDDLVMTNFDKKSIMIYSFPKEFYRKGKKSSCFIAASNSRISKTDRKTIDHMYSADAEARIRNFEDTKTRLTDLMKQADAKGTTKSIGVDHVMSYLETQGVTADEE